MRALDTSVVVPAVVAWHEAHDDIVAVLRDDDTLPAHVALEAYSLLTRLPAPLRTTPVDAAGVLRARFAPPYLGVGGATSAALVDRLADAGVRGGAAYDGLIAVCAQEAGLVLLTRDRRAVTTYDALDVAYERIG